MADAALLQAILDEMDDALVQARFGPVSHTKNHREFHVFKEPISRSEAEQLRDLPRSHRWCTAGPDENLIAGYEWWPALEPVYTVRDRVERYRDLALGVRPMFEPGPK